MKTLKEYGIHHVGFVVKDVDETAKVFKERFGIEASPSYNFIPNVVYSYGEKEAEYELKICMVTMDDGKSFELIQPVKGNGVHQRFIDEGHNGMHHVCYSVDDYDYWREHFGKENVQIVFESETEDELNGYRRCFYAEDTDCGMVFEIKENPYFRK